MSVYVYMHHTEHHQTRITRPCAETSMQTPQRTSNQRGTLPSSAVRNGPVMPSLLYSSTKTLKSAALALDAGEVAMQTDGDENMDSMMNIDEPSSGKPPFGNGGNVLAASITTPSASMRRRETMQFQQSQSQSQPQFNQEQGHGQGQQDRVLTSRNGNNGVGSQGRKVRRAIDPSRRATLLTSLGSNTGEGVMGGLSLSQGSVMTSSQQNQTESIGGSLLQDSHVQQSSALYPSESQSNNDGGILLSQQYSQHSNQYNGEHRNDQSIQQSQQLFDHEQNMGSQESNNKETIEPMKSAILSQRLEAEYESFKESCSQTLQRFEQWVGAVKTHVNDARSKHVAIVSEQQQNAVILQSQLKSAEAVKEKLQETMNSISNNLSAEETEISMLEKNNSEAQTELSKLKEILETKRNIYNERAKRVQALSTEQDRQEKDTNLKLKHFEEKTGLKIKGVSPNVLEFVFDCIDVKNPFREFRFVLDFSNDKLYKVLTCVPSLSNDKTVLDDQDTNEEKVCDPTDVVLKSLIVEYLNRPISRSNTFANLENIDMSDKNQEEFRPKRDIFGFIKAIRSKFVELAQE